VRRQYARALLKLSGEALAGERGYGLDYKVVDAFAEELLRVHARGLQLSLVVGGGNILRGTQASQQGLDRQAKGRLGLTRHGEQADLHLAQFVVEVTMGVAHPNLPVM
jgi:uridylate kinase